MIELGKDDVFVVEIREKEGKEENHMVIIAYNAVIKSYFSICLKNNTCGETRVPLIRWVNERNQAPTGELTH